MKLARRRALALALLVVASPHAARGARNTASAVLNDVNNLNDYEESATDPVSVSVAFTNPIFGDAFHAAAIATLGAVRANTSYAVDEFSRSAASGSTIESAQADTQDRLTITGGTPGTAGKLHITFTFEGSATENEPGKAWGEYVFFANTFSQSFIRSRFLQGIVNGPVTRDPIDFNFGEGFLLTFGVMVEIRQTGPAESAPFVPVLATIDYANISWTGSAVTDANGDPVPGFAITSESGTHYPTSAPEPEAALLQFASAGVLVAWKMQRGADSHSVRRTVP